MVSKNSLLGELSLAPLEDAGSPSGTVASGVNSLRIRDNHSNDTSVLSLHYTGQGRGEEEGERDISRDMASFPSH